MKRILTYTTALTLLAAPAFADAKADMVRGAQSMLNEYNIPVDADTLTTAQLAEIETLDPSATEATQLRLEQIVGVAADPEASDMSVANPNVVIGIAVPESDAVQAILDEYDINVDADDLSQSQRAEILALDTEETEFTKTRLETIVSG